MWIGPTLGYLEPHGKMVVLHTRGYQVQASRGFASGASEHAEVPVTGVWITIPETHVPRRASDQSWAACCYSCI